MTDLPYRKATGPLLFVILIGSLLLFQQCLEPSWEATKVRSRMSECAVNLEIIADAQAVLCGSDAGCLACPRFPPTQPTRAVTWEDAPQCWRALGFERDVGLWGQYLVRTTAAGWTATCSMDADGDGQAARWSASEDRTAAADPKFED